MQQSKQAPASSCNNEFSECNKSRELQQDAASTNATKQGNSNKLLQQRCLQYKMHNDTRRQAKSTSEYEIDLVISTMSIRTHIMLLCTSPFALNESTCRIFSWLQPWHRNPRKEPRCRPTRSPATGCEGPAPPRRGTSKPGEAQLSQESSLTAP